MIQLTFLLFCLQLSNLDFAYGYDDDHFGNQRIGCFMDSVKRDMDGYNQIYKDLTPELCIGKCREHGFTYAGLRHTDECHCDNQYGQYGKVNESECSSPCAGDTSLTCGGDRRTSVYTVCPAGKYGADCRFDCPLLCGRNESEFCHFGTGSCIYACEKGYSHCNEKQFDCYVLKADPRKEVDEMNESPGVWFNLFHGISFSKAGRISRIKYNAERKGIAFVAFWRRVLDTGHAWTMVGKVKIEAPGNGTHSVNATEDIYVSPGDVIGVHYDKDRDAQSIKGVIDYERSTYSPSAGVAKHLLKPFYNANLRDNDWKPWFRVNLSTSNIVHSGRAPALHITLDCLQKTCPDRKYGPNCTHDCLPSCMDSICSPINGECLLGCIPRWMGSHCIVTCPENCKNGLCDRLRGLCSEGCEPGYSGDECEHQCKANAFGAGCKYTCHCAEGISCNHVTGYCMGAKPVGNCASGWTGHYCDILISSLQKIGFVPAVLGFIFLTIIICALTGAVVYLLLKFRYTGEGFFWFLRFGKRSRSSDDLVNNMSVEENVPDDNLNVVKF